MIRVTLEFTSIEETIVALGKMSALGKARRAAQEQVGAGQPSAPAQEAKVVDQPAPAPATRTRKPRSDAGKPRGPYNKETEGAGVGAQSEDAVSAAAPAATPAPEVSASSTAAPAAATAGEAKSLTDNVAPTQKPSAPPAAAVPSLEDAQAALKVLFEAKGAQQALAVLNGFGVNRVKEVPEDKRAAFIEAAKKAAA